MPGTYDKTYPNIKDLDLIPVHSENGAAYFKVNKLPESLSYGKHYFLLSWFGDNLKDGSIVNFEFKDSKGNTIFSDISDYNIINGSAVCYVWLKKDPLRINDEIADGLGTLTIVGELQSVPERWVGVPNVRYKIPISIEKNTPNTSNIVFDNPSNIQASSSFSETQLNDTAQSGTPFYKRSYLVVSASHMEVISGKVNFIEVSYREIKSKTSDFKVISTYPITGSPYEVTESAASGLNPLSNQAKVLLPRDIRRNSEIEFKLRFIDGQGRYAQDLTSKTEKDIIVTGSISTVSGSPIIVETSDNLVKGDIGGSFIFGSSLNEGFKIDFKDKTSGKFKGENTLEFTPIKSGIEQKTFAVAEQGGFVNDINSNTITQSADASMIGTISSSITSSTDSSIFGSSNSSIKFSGKSVIIGGSSQRIHSTSSLVTLGLDELSNSILGGSGNTISSSISSGSRIMTSTIIGGTTNLIFQTSSANLTNSSIVGGTLNRIDRGVSSTIIGGFSNQMSSDNGIIIGGSANDVQHNRSVIIGMVGKTTEATDTVYVQNLSVDGSINANSLDVTHFTSSFITASTIQTSGSNIFGDAITDTHTFNGHITASGNISASGDIIATDVFLPTEAGRVGFNTNNHFEFEDGKTKLFHGGGSLVQFTNTGGGNTGVVIGNGGANATDPPITGLTVIGAISASGDLFKTKFVQMTNSSSAIDTFNTGSFRSAKYVLQVTSASKYQVSEMLVLHNDGTALNTEYAQINSGTNLIDFSTDVNGANVRLNASGDFISCSVRLDRTIIPT